MNATVYSWLQIDVFLVYVCIKCLKQEELALGSTVVKLIFYVSRFNLQFYGAQSDFPEVFKHDFLLKN